MVSEEGRLCNRCKDFKPWDSFAINSKGINNRKSICKNCSNKAQRALAKKKRESDPLRTSLHQREKSLFSKYGITLADYDEMLKEQNYCCKICGKTENAIGENFYVDHCHSSGSVRGLLCSHCNTGLGMFGDDTLLLSKAIRYLQESRDRDE